VPLWASYSKFFSELKPLRIFLALAFKSWSASNRQYASVVVANQYQFFIGGWRHRVVGRVFLMTRCDYGTMVVSSAGVDHERTGIVAEKTQPRR